MSSKHCEGLGSVLPVKILKRTLKAFIGHPCIPVLLSENPELWKTQRNRRNFPKWAATDYLPLWNDQLPQMIKRCLCPRMIRLWKHFSLNHFQTARLWGSFASGWGVLQKAEVFLRQPAFLIFVSRGLNSWGNHGGREGRDEGGWRQEKKLVKTQDRAEATAGHSREVAMVVCVPSKSDF